MVLAWGGGLFACGGEPPAADPPIPAESPAVAPQHPPEERRIEIGSYTEVLDLFEELGYTPAAWQAGVREVPRVFIAEIGERWRGETTKQITVQLKKRLFFRALAPLVLRANEMILEDRARAETTEDEAWLQDLARRYDVPDADLEELLKRVDIVPVSLALSQGAEESGWARRVLPRRATRCSGSGPGARTQSSPSSSAKSWAITASPPSRRRCSRCWPTCTT